MCIRDRVYRLSNIPRSISWDAVNRVLAGVDRRTEAGRRDYAILLLLVTYGLRGDFPAAQPAGDPQQQDGVVTPARFSPAVDTGQYPVDSVPGNGTGDVREPVD